MRAGHAALGIGGDPRPLLPGLPGPGVAEPELRHEMELGGLGPPVQRRDDGVDVVGIRLGVLDRDVEEPAVLEDPGLRDLVFRPVAPARQVLAHQRLVGERRLRVAVELLEVGVARDRVEVVVDLLDVLAVVALLIGQAEQAFLEDAVAPVPQGQGQAQAAALVADPRQPVLAPPIGTGAGLLVRQCPPGIAVGAVILPHGPPLPLGEIGAPQGPRPVAPALLGDPAALRPIDRVHLRPDSSAASRARGGERPAAGCAERRRNGHRSRRAATEASARCIFEATPPQVGGPCGFPGRIRAVPPRTSASPERPEGSERFRIDPARRFPMLAALTPPRVENRVRPASPQIRTRTASLARILRAGARGKNSLKRGGRHENHTVNGHCWTCDDRSRAGSGQGRSLEDRYFGRRDRAVCGLRRAGEERRQPGDRGHQQGRRHQGPALRARLRRRRVRSEAGCLGGQQARRGRRDHGGRPLRLQRVDPGLRRLSRRRHRPGHPGLHQREVHRAGHVEHLPHLRARRPAGCGGGHVPGRALQGQADRLRPRQVVVRQGPRPGDADDAQGQGRRRRCWSRASTRARRTIRRSCPS